MSKKSKSKIKINLILYAISILLAVVSICMIFTNVCGIQNGDKLGYQITGLQATFGYSETYTALGITKTSVYTTFSFFNFLIYVLLLIGVVLAVLKLLKIVKSDMIDWIATGLFIIAGVLYFIVPNFVVYGNAWVDLVELAIKADGVKTLLFGGIVGGLSAVLAGASIIASKLIKKK